MRSRHLLDQLFELHGTDGRLLVKEQRVDERRRAAAKKHVGQHAAVRWRQDLDQDVKALAQHHAAYVVSQKQQVVERQRHLALPLKTAGELW